MEKLANSFTKNKIKRFYILSDLHFSPYNLHPMINSILSLLREINLNLQNRKYNEVYLILNGDIFDFWYVPLSDNEITIEKMRTSIYVNKFISAIKNLIESYSDEYFKIIYVNGNHDSGLTTSDINDLFFSDNRIKLCSSCIFDPVKSSIETESLVEKIDKSNFQSTIKKLKFIHGNQIDLFNFTSKEKIISEKYKNMWFRNKYPIGYLMTRIFAENDKRNDTMTLYNETPSSLIRLINVIPNLDGLLNFENSEEFYKSIISLQLFSSDKLREYRIDELSINFNGLTISLNDFIKFFVAPIDEFKENIITNSKLSYLFLKTIGIKNISYFKNLYLKTIQFSIKDIINNSYYAKLEPFIVNDMLNTNYIISGHTHKMCKIDHFYYNSGYANAKHFKYLRIKLTELNKKKNKTFEYKFTVKVSTSPEEPLVSQFRKKTIKFYSDTKKIFDKNNNSSTEPPKLKKIIYLSNKKFECLKCKDKNKKHILIKAKKSQDKLGNNTILLTGKCLDCGKNIFEKKRFITLNEEFLPQNLL